MLLSRTQQVTQLKGNIPLESCNKHCKCKRTTPGIKSSSIGYNLTHNANNDVDIVDGDRKNKQYDYLSIFFVLFEWRSDIPSITDSFQIPIRKVGRSLIL